MLHFCVATELCDMDDYISCFACGAKSINLEGDCHEYMLSSPGCWMMFNEVLEEEYTDLRYAKGHQFTVDAYACQHIGRKEDQRAVNSVNIHLASLFYLFEEKRDVSKAPTLRQQFAQYYKNKGLLEWLTPPKTFGKMTVYDVWDNENPEMHFEIAEKWARSTWEAWTHQHERIAQLADKVKIL